MDEELMGRIDKWMRARVEERGMPHDFDDVTWAIHDFVKENNLREE